MLDRNRRADVASLLFVSGKIVNLHIVIIITCLEKK